MHGAFIIAALLAPLQDRDAEFLGHVNDFADRAASLDPFVRAEARQALPDFFRKNEAKIVRLAQSKDDARRIPALILAAIMGKHDPLKLLDLDDVAARVVGCDQLTVDAGIVQRLLGFFDDAKVSVRIAAARALGRVEDATLRSQIQIELSKFWQDPKAGPEDALAYYVMAHWYPASYAQSIQSYMSQPDPATVETCIAALLNLPSFEPGGSLESQAASALRNEKVSLRLRELLVKMLAKEMPSALLGLLTTPQPKLRSQVVDSIDRTLDNPIFVKPLVELWKKDDIKRLDDGKEPPQPLTAWIEKWLGRLTAEAGGIDKAEEWLRVKFKSVLDERADKAIKKGVEALRKLQKEDGTWTFNSSYPVGVTGLTVYTLLKCDVKPDDKDLLRGVDVMMTKDPEGTYSAACVGMALATLLEKLRAQKKNIAALPKLPTRLQEIMDILIASQKNTGGWSYDIKTKTGTGIQAPAPAPGGEDRYDFSNTQFAVLSLRAGANQGARVPRTTWERALVLYEKHQNEKDGGWPYIGLTPGQPGTAGSSLAMSAAGAYGWMIIKTSLNERLSPEDARDQKRVQDALGYLAKSWQVDATGLADVYYWLYSVERMAMAGRVDSIGGHDWYVEGATWLLARQKPDGEWVGNYGSTVDTCLALLFLKRAYIATPYIETGEGRKKSK